ncbi:MAG: hypothetical protein M3342_10130 [Bacteroidota bacterium]|nr:hypothetical protein [Bacteroidota bacterium]
MQSLYTTLEKRIQGSCLIIAPFLFGLSTFFWQGGEYGVTSATLIILSLFFWIPAWMGLFDILKEKRPRYAVWGLWVAVYGCISGVCFAFLGYLTSIFHIPHKTYIEELSQYPLSSQVLLFASGPLFPSSLLILGIVLLRTRLVPLPVGLLLCLAAIAFPLSRIGRVEWMAHIADLLLLIPCFYLGLKIIQRERAIAASQGSL